MLVVFIRGDITVKIDIAGNVCSLSVVYVRDTIDTQWVCVSRVVCMISLRDHCEVQKTCHVRKLLFHILVAHIIDNSANRNTLCLCALKWSSERCDAYRLMCLLQGEIDILRCSEIFCGIEGLCCRGRMSCGAT